MSPTQVNLVFFANRVSHKFDELQNDVHVNVSFYDEKTTNWASYAGTAKVSQDKDKIAQHWSPMFVSPLLPPPTFLLPVSPSPTLL